MKSGFLLMFVLVLTGCTRQDEPSGPRAPETAAERGAELFYRHCAVCHEAEPGTPGTGGSLAGVFQRPPHRLRDGTEILPTEEAISEFILKGNSNMPPMDRALSQRDLEDVLAYLHTL